MSNYTLTLAYHFLSLVQKLAAAGVHSASSSSSNDINIIQKYVAEWSYLLEC